MDASELRVRLKFIELVAYWEGKVNTTHIAQQFGLSRQQCSSALNAYLNSFPGNLEYNKSIKAYQANENFVLSLTNGEADEYLHWLHTGYLSQPLSPTLYLPHILLNLPARKVPPQVMRGLVAGIRQRRRVEVDYRSLSNPSQDGRIISPHAFVNMGLRWHLRAWCEKSKQYRDFVLSRFRGTAELLDKSAHTSEKDNAWNTQVTVILQPDHRLPPAKRQVLENDYQMQNGQLRISTRGSLVQYLLREMQINTKMLDGVPEAQQLVCVNLVDIKDWLFDS